MFVIIYCLGIIAVLGFSGALADDFHHGKHNFLKHHHHKHGYLKNDKSMKLLHHYFKDLKHRISDIRRCEKRSNEKAVYPIPSDLGAVLHNIIDDDEVYTVESHYESNNTFVAVGNITLSGVDKLIFRYEFDMNRINNPTNSLFQVSKLTDSKSGVYATEYTKNLLTSAGCKNIPDVFVDMNYMNSCEEAEDLLIQMEFTISILATDYLEALKAEGDKKAYYVDDLGNICEDYKVFNLKPFSDIDREIPDINKIPY